MINDVPRTFVGTTTFVVSGMTGAHCRDAVSAEIRHVAGVEEVTVDLPTGTVTVLAHQPVDRADIAAAVAGYTSVP